MFSTYLDECNEWRNAQAPLRHAHQIIAELQCENLHLKFENVGSLQTIDEIQEENNTLKAENGHLLELLTEEMYKNVQITQTFAREMKLQSTTYSKKGDNTVLSQI